MDLAFTPQELAFRDEIRGWVKDNLPADIAHKVHHALRLSRDDMQRWAKILGKKGWLGYGWPKEFGGAGLDRRAEAPVRRRVRPGRRAARGALWSGDGGAGDHGVWQQGAAGAFPARHRQR